MQFDIDHTPGPWVLTETTDTYNVTTPPTEHSLGSPVCEIRKLSLWTDREEKFAHLIAAAPELLDALDTALLFIQNNATDQHERDCGCPQCTVVCVARNAINKALNLKSEVQD
jgi:hypothetical protein